MDVFRIVMKFFRKGNREPHIDRKFSGKKNSGANQCVYAKFPRSQNIFPALVIKRIFPL